jgi:ferredoxin
MEHEVNMRVRVNWDLCESNALCMGVAPEVFEVGEDDELSLLMEEPPEHLRAEVQQAAASCPKGAITLLD